LATRLGARPSGFVSAIAATNPGHRSPYSQEHWDSSSACASPSLIGMGHPALVTLQVLGNELGDHGTAKCTTRTARIRYSTHAGQLHLSGVLSDTRKNRRMKVLSVPPPLAMA